MTALPEIIRWNKGDRLKFPRYQNRIGGKRIYSISRDGVGWRINPIENVNGEVGYLLITNIELRSGGKFGSWAISRNGSAHTLPTGGTAKYGREMYRTPASACAVARRMHPKYAAAVKRRAEEKR